VWLVPAARGDLRLATVSWALFLGPFGVHVITIVPGHPPGEPQGLAVGPFPRATTQPLIQLGPRVLMRLRASWYPGVSVDQFHWAPLGIGPPTPPERHSAATARRHRPSSLTFDVFSLSIQPGEP
jgi:hypothetical protein